MKYKNNIIKIFQIIMKRKSTEDAGPGPSSQRSKVNRVELNNIMRQI